MIPFRMDEHEELLGADYAEHNIHHPDVGVTRGGWAGGALCSTGSLNHHDS